MRNNLIFNNKNTKTVRPDEMLKTTALIYLTDSLVQEDYESCSEIIDRAKKFGASRTEISRLITGFIKGINNGQKTSNKRTAGGRLRFYGGY